MSTTARVVRLTVGRRLKERDDTAFYEFLNTGTSASQITDAVNLASTRFTSQKFENYFMRQSDASAAAPDGEKTFARVLTPSSGVLTLSPSVTTAFASSDTGELWPPSLDPDTVDRATDRGLAEFCTRWRLVPLSRCIDPDFLVDDLADATPTHWSASSATATVTNRSGMERFCERVLRVANSGANGYAGQTVNVLPSKTYVFWAVAQADVGTAQVVIYDLTNSAALAQTAITRTTHDGEAFQIISFTVDTASTTEQVSVRVGGSGASDDTYWANVMFYQVQDRDLMLPARLVDRSRVGDFWIFRGSDWGEGQLVKMRRPHLIDAGGGFVRALFHEPVGTNAIFYEEFANYAALGSTYHTAAGRRTRDAATTDCPVEYVVQATLKMLGMDDHFDAAHAKYGAKVRARFTRDRVGVSA